MPDQYEEAIAAYSRALPPGEMVEFSTAPLDRLGVPARTATFFARDGRTRGGLGYGVSDANNALRLDLVVLYMVLVGALGIALDRLLAQLTRLPAVRWGYER